MTLEQLSAAASELLPCPFCGGSDVVQGVIRVDHVFQFVECTKCGIEMVGHTEAEAIAAWNTRTGQFVAVADDAIERVARALRVKCAEIDHRPDVNSADPMWFAHEYALAAIAAMKDTQPALAAKGTGDE